MIRFRRMAVALEALASALRMGALAVAADPLPPGQIAFFEHPGHYQIERTDANCRSA